MDRVVIDQRGEVARSGTSAFAGAPVSGRWPQPPTIRRLCLRQGSAAQGKCEPKPAAAAAAPVAAKPITIAAKELFDYDKAILKPEGKAAIDREVVEKLKSAGPVRQILVTGHTDRLGSQQYNQKLSEKRAEVVKGYLVSKGLPVDKIETMGAGKTQPATGVPKCDDKLPKKKLIECLAPHRRVTIDVTADPKK